MKSDIKRRAVSIVFILDVVASSLVAITNWTTTEKSITCFLMGLVICLVVVICAKKD